MITKFTIILFSIAALFFAIFVFYGYYHKVELRWAAWLGIITAFIGLLDLRVKSSSND